MTVGITGSEIAVAIQLQRMLFVVTDQKMRLWPFAIVLMNALLILILVFVFRKVLSVRGRRIAYACLSIYALFLAVASIPSALTYRQFHEAAWEYRHGDYLIAEGTVHGYEVSPNRIIDCFYVGQVKFCVSPLNTGPGYHQTRARGADDVRDGVRAKIFYKGSVIFRIDLSD